MRLKQIFSGYILPLSLPVESKSDWVASNVLFETVDWSSSALFLSIPPPLIPHLSHYIKLLTNGYFLVAFCLLIAWKFFLKLFIP